jgi:hypothetical protein
MLTDERLHVRDLLFGSILPIGDEERDLGVFGRFLAHLPIEQHAPRLGRRHLTESDSPLLRAGRARRLRSFGAAGDQHRREAHRNQRPRGTA